MPGIDQDNEELKSYLSTNHRGRRRRYSKELVSQDSKGNVLTIEEYKLFLKLHLLLQKVVTLRVGARPLWCPINKTHRGQSCHTLFYKWVREAQKD
jgi:hypothetical protein